MDDDAEDIVAEVGHGIIRLERSLPESDAVLWTVVLLASVFDVLTTGDYLDDYGFLLGEQFPTTSGDVPPRVSTVFDSASDDRSRLGRPHSPLSETVSDITVLL